MAIQAQMYREGSGLPLFSAPDWVGGGGEGAAGLHEEMCLHMQRQQMLIAARQMQQFQNQRNQRVRTSQILGGVNPTPAPPAAAPFLTRFAEDQRLEIDQYIHAENERLRPVLQEQRRRDLIQFLSKIESRTRFLLDQKDDELYKASTRTSQLENLVIRMESENQMWQNIARQNELHAINLSNTIDHLEAAAAVGAGELYNPEIADEASCCDENVAVESAGVEQQRNVNKPGVMMMVCQICESRERRVLFLPCRHLVSCSVCDAMIDFCPVCQTEKKASMEVLIQN